jgi:hypothetical protein
MLKLERVKNIICVISFHTYGWIEPCFADLQKYCYNKPLLMIDNNPSWDDSYERWCTYECHPASCWKPQCEDERNFIESQRSYIESTGGAIIQTERRLYHGNVIDWALEWCKANKFHTITLIEPDCNMTGDLWLKNLEDAILRGYWMAGTHTTFHNAIHPFGSIWRIDKISTSFHAQPNREIRNLKEFNKVCGPYEEPYNIWNRTNWDTGLRGWYLIARQNKAKLVKAPDIKHYWGGSYRQRKYTERFENF